MGVNFKIYWINLNIFNQTIISETILRTPLIERVANFLTLVLVGFLRWMMSDPSVNPTFENPQKILTKHPENKPKES